MLTVPYCRFVVKQGILGSLGSRFRISGLGLAGNKGICHIGIM